MADKKISELTSITGANVDDANDTIAIVDSSAGQTKKITRAELFKDVDGADFAGNVTLSNPNLGSLRVKRGTSGREWGIGTVGDSTAMSVYDVDNTEIVARFDERGTSIVSATTSVITAEKGDARYAQLDGQQFIDSDAVTDFKVGRDANQHFALWGDASGNVITSVAASGNLKPFVLNAVNSPEASPYIFKEDGSVIAYIESGSTASGANSLMTREKGDARYAQLSGANFTGNLGIKAPNSTTNTFFQFRNPNNTVFSQFFTDFVGNRQVLGVSDTSGGNTEYYNFPSAVGDFSNVNRVLRNSDIERGSNANGEYVRFPDGTQICTSTVTLDPTSATGYTDYSYPATFDSAPSASISFGETNTGSNKTVIKDMFVAPGTGSWAVHHYQAAGATTITVRLTAIGTWS